MKKIFTLLFITMFSVTLLSPALVSAQTSGGTTGGSVGSQINKALGDVGKGAGFKSESETGGLPQLVGTIINIFLGILGVLFVILIIYGGYTWMTSFGNKDKVDRGKTLIVDAVIGLIIILAAYAISSFVVGSLIKATVK